MRQPITPGKASCSGKEISSVYYEAHLRIILYNIDENNYVNNAKWLSKKITWEERRQRTQEVLIQTTITFFSQK